MVKAVKKAIAEEKETKVKTSKKKVAEKDIETLIDNYGAAKEEEKIVKAKVDTANKGIKAYFKENDLKEFKCKSGWKASITVVESVSYDQESMLALLKKKKLNDCIEVVETINWDKVKDKIIEGKLKSKDMDKYETTTTSERLGIKKVANGEE